MTVVATMPRTRTPYGAARVENFDTRLSAETEEALRAIDINMALAARRMATTKVGHNC
jgi:hypothetical protein